MKKKVKSTKKIGASSKLMFPRATIEEAIKIPFAIKDKNGGNPWSPSEIANALGVSAKTNSFYYLSAASRDYGFIAGSLQDYLNPEAADRT